MISLTQTNTTVPLFTSGKGAASWRRNDTKMAIANAVDTLERYSLTFSEVISRRWKYTSKAPTVMPSMAMLIERKAK